MQDGVGRRDGPLGPFLRFQGPAPGVRAPPLSKIGRRVPAPTPARSPGFCIARLED
jgi:hypothetical protein